jgi:hypothetical protein
MSELSPRFDSGERAAEGSRRHDLGAPAVLQGTRHGKEFEQVCDSAAGALTLATEMLHRREGMPVRIVFADGVDIGPVAIRQEYERLAASGRIG